LTLDGWLVALIGLAFALGFLVGRRDSEQIDNKVINSNFWNGFEMGYHAHMQDALDKEKDL
jgi:hypothetical protein